MTSDDASCPLARAMRETLDAVVTPVVREALIHDALILAGLGSLPQRGDAMRAFAGEQLRAVVARALGAEMAASITEEILLTIGPSTPPPVRSPSPRSSRVPSYRRTHSPPPAPRRTPVVMANPESTRAPLPPPARSATPAVHSARRRVPVEPAWPVGIGSYLRTRSPAPGISRALRDTDPVGAPQAIGSIAPASGIMPFVLVATLDAALLGVFATSFEGRARVCLVRTPAELVKRLEAIDGTRCLVILDGKSPSLRPAALAVLLEELSSIDVVFCRADPAAEALALSVSPSVSRWLVYREPSRLDQVAAECMRLVS
jgi:hypothetical protein